jgi:hypothetical protein
MEGSFEELSKTESAVAKTQEFAAIWISLNGEVKTGDGSFG